MLNLHWCIETNLMALEAIAAGAGVELDDVEEPVAAVSAYGPACRHLESSLAALPAGDPMARYELRKSVRLARHVGRIGEIGDQVVAADLADIAKLTGWRADSWAEGEADLERFVLGDDGTHDEELVRIFQRRLHRARMLTGPAGSWITRHREAPQPRL
jgi:hypothetical protein